MANDYIIYHDEAAGYEDSQFRFLKNAFTGDEIPTGADHLNIRIGNLEWEITGNSGDASEWTSSLENGNLHYMSSDTHAGKFAGYILHDSPTPGYAEIVYDGWYMNGDNTDVLPQYYHLSSGDGTLITSNDVEIDISTNAPTIGGVNYGATIGLSVPFSLDPDGANWQWRKNAANTIVIAAPFPIFKDRESLIAYIYSGDLSGCINLIDQFNTTTGLYWIYCKYQLCQQVRGTLTPVDGTSPAWHSQKFEANKMPTLYFASDNNYVLKLQARQVVASKASTTPGYILDNVPQSAWTLGELEYTGDYYGTINDFVQAKGKVLKDGQYVVSVDFQTNIPIFKDKAAADAAEASDDYTEAINDYDLTEGNTHRKTELGDEEITTLFGDGTVTSPFVAVYLCDRTDVLNIVNVFYTTNASVLDNIKEGLALFGAQPYESLVSLAWFPFDVSDLVQTQPATSIWFGSYEHTGMSVKRVTSLIADYIDAGTVNITAPFLSYRDYDPYFEISVWLPYHGWEKLETKKYVGKSVNIRYYVDILTCTYIIALVISDGTNTWLGDTYSGNIGVMLPTCGNNLSQYANTMLQTIIGAGAGVVGGAVGGAMFGGGAGAAIGGMLGGAAGIAKGAFDIAQKPKPKDMTVTRGAFTAGAASYMPQYVIFRLDYHDLIVPENLTGMYGRPSSAAGTIGSFSGFLKVSTCKLNTSGMSDYEIAELTNLLESGIFVS